MLKTILIHSSWYSRYEDNATVNIRKIKLFQDPRLAQKTLFYIRFVPE